MSRSCLTSLVLFLSACASAPHPTEAETPESAPAGDTKAPAASADFNTLLAREIEPLKPTPFSMSEGALQGVVEAKQAPQVERHDGFSQLSASIGSESALVCMVYDEDLRLGQALSTLLKGVTEDGEIKFSRLGVDSVEAIANAGALYATGLYTTKQSGGATGMLKIFLHGSFEHGVVCMHDEVGYRKSFARITKGLAESLKFTPRLGKTRLVDLAKATLGAQPIGFTQTVVTQGDNGALWSVSSTVRLLPVAPNELASSDSLAVLALDPTHHIVSGTYSAYQGVDALLSLEVERKDNGRYHYKGTAKEKPVEGDFATKDKKGLVASVARDQQISELFRTKKNKTLKFEDYDPESDAAKLESVSIALDAASKSAKVNFGESVLEEQLADDGFPQSGRMQIGKNALLLERLVRTGSL